MDRLRTDFGFDVAEVISEESVTLANIPSEVRSRVMAATAHARVRWVEQRAGEENLHGYEVYAVAGDRFVHMLLALRPDGSVAEETETVLLTQIVNVVLGDDHAAIEVSEGSGRRRIPIPFALLPALPDGGGDPI
jgi:hypothetical protein